MSTRIRWALIAAGIAIAMAVAVALLWPGQPEMHPMGTDRGSTTWVVPPAEVLILSPDQVHPDNVYRCAGDEGVNVEVTTDGSATAYCGGPPGY